MAGRGFEFRRNEEGGGMKNYPGKINCYVLTTYIVASMGGLLFGYDIGGVTSIAPFLQRFFPSVYQKEDFDTSTNQYCKFDSFTLTMFTSSLYLATLLASFVASWVTKTFGSKKSMLLGGFVFLIGAVINAAAQNIIILIIGRICLSIGVGFSLQSIPLYVLEMAPPKYRGSLNVVFQLSITIGILVANFVNYGTTNIYGGWGWRVSLGGAAMPALFITISALFLPDTPTSMLERGDVEKARAILQRIRGVSEKDVEEEFQDIMLANMTAKTAKQTRRNWRERQNRLQLVMSILIKFFQQLTGINVAMFYVPVVLKTIGFGDNASLLSSVIAGGINVLATFLSVYGNDNWGRRILFLLGGINIFFFQVSVGVFIAWKFGVYGEVAYLPKWYAGVVVLFICLFVQAFAWSWWPLRWLVSSKIFSLEARSAAQSTTVSVNMFFTFLMARIFLTMFCHMKFGLFFFAFFVALMTLFIYLFLPEIKSILIEDTSCVWTQLCPNNMPKFALKFKILKP